MASEPCPHCGQRVIPAVPGVTYCTHCGKAVELGARESTAVCEALQRGAA